MKVTLISILILISTCNLFAQIAKGKILITVSGNYRNNENFGNGNKPKSDALNIGGSIGYFFSDRFVAGGGLDYNHQHELDYYTSSPIYPSRQSMTLTVKGLFPYVYMGYYLPIVPKLYFNTNFKVSTGQDKTTIEDSPTNYYNFETERVEAQITPELSYFFAKQVGVYLGFGGLSYITSKSMSADTKNWLVNFNPEYWKIGFKAAF